MEQPVGKPTQQPTLSVGAEQLGAAVYQKTASINNCSLLTAWFEHARQRAREEAKAEQ